MDTVKQVTRSLQWRTVPHGKRQGWAGLPPRFQISGTSCSWDRGTGLSGAHCPADLLCQNMIVWSWEQKWMRKREHCTEKVACCAKTHFSTDDLKRPLKPQLPLHVNSWLASLQGTQILWLNKNKRCEEGHKHILIVMWHVMEQEMVAQQGWGTPEIFWRDKARVHTSPFCSLWVSAQSLLPVLLFADSEGLAFARGKVS